MGISFVGFTCLPIFIICSYFEELRKYETLALLMILSGGFGNLIDRVFMGSCN